MRWFLLVSLVAILGEPSRVEPALSLQWDAPPECPTGDSVLARVSELRERGVDGADEASFTASVSGGGGGYSLTLRTEYAGATETRVVEDVSCDALADATALIIAASLSDAQKSTPSPLVPAPAPSTGTEIPSGEPASVDLGPAQPDDLDAAASRPAPADERGRDRRRRPVGWGLSAAPVAEFGALPGFSGGARAAVGVKWRRVSVAGFGFWVAPRETATVRGARGLAQFAAGGVRGCLRAPVGKAYIPICAVLEAGLLWVNSRGLEPTRRLRYAWVAPGGRVGVERHWGRWGVFAAAELAVPLDRPRMLIGQETAFESLSVSVRMLAGVSIFFSTDLD